MSSVNPYVTLDVEMKVLHVMLSIICKLLINFPTVYRNKQKKKIILPILAGEG